jgi:hypothetical protein
MAKVIAPLLSASASGQFAHAMTFDKRGYVRKYVKPFNPQLPEQMQYRNVLGDIQRELKQLGLVLRPQVKLALGYRWNTKVIAELTGAEQATWLAHLATFDDFTTGKAAWVSNDPGLGLVTDPGGPFYAVARAFYDVCLRVSGDGLIDEPVESNAATIAAAWIDDIP